MSFPALRPYLAAACAVMALVSLVIPHPGLRLAGVFLFVAFGPGLAVIRWFGTGDYRDMVLIIAFSLALHVVLAVIMTYTGVWSPPGLVLIVALSVLILASIEVARTRRPSAEPSGKEAE